MPFKERVDGKHTGRWIAKIVWEGQQVWLGAHDTKREAGHVEDVERAERLLNKKRGGTVETCESFAARWTTDYPRPKETSNRHNAERVRKFAAEFKAMPLRDVDRVTARAWALRNPGHISAVRAMFSDAFNDGLVESNPFAGLRISKPNRRQETIQVLSEVQVRELADCALKAHPGDYGREARAMILFTAFMGIRPGEMIALRWDDIDEPIVRVERQRNKHGELTSPKNGRRRIVVLTPPARQALEDVPDRGGTIFRSKTGRELSAGTLFYAWDKIRTSWGRPGLDFYECTRHFAATYMLDILGLSHADVAVQLGHRDGGALVMSTYGHPSEDLARGRILKAFEQVEAGRVVPIRQVGT